MPNRRTLLALAFTLCFCSAARLAQAQGWCQEVVGMSACDPAYPGVWADCNANSYLEECLASDSDTDSCWEIAAHIWSSEYNSASRDCSLIEQECRLTGGWRNSYGGCSIFLAGGAGGGGYEWAGWSSGGLECRPEYVHLEVNIGGRWISIWEGWATVCEDAM